MTIYQSADPDLGEYLREIGEWPLLTSDEEIQLAREMELGRRAARRLAATQTISARRRAALECRLQAGEQARIRLIQSNLRLVVSIARRYRGRGLSLLDLIQEGNIGLQTGIDRYQWRKRLRLSTYVYWWIRQSIVRALANQARIIRLPVHAGELVRRAARVEERLEADLSREPTLAEVAAELGVALTRLQTLRAIGSALASLDAPVGEDRTNTQADLVPDEAASSALQLATDRDELSGEVRQALEDLPPRERDVLRWRFGLGRPENSLAQVGSRLGVTRERARQLEDQALRRLRGNPRLQRALVDLASA